MCGKCIFRASLLIALLGLLSAPAWAAQRTLTLDDPPASACDEPWMEGNCEITLVNTTWEDCMTPGNCWFSSTTYPGGLYFPYRMLVDLTGLTGIERVEVEVYDGWEDGCVIARLYANGSLQDVVVSQNHGTWETLILNVAALPVTQFVISGWDGAVREIRILGDWLTPVDETAWSSVKSLY